MLPVLASPFSFLCMPVAESSVPLVGTPLHAGCAVSVRCRQYCCRPSLRSLLVPCSSWASPSTHACCWGAAAARRVPVLTAVAPQALRTPRQEHIFGVLVGSKWDQWGGIRDALQAGCFFWRVAALLPSLVVGWKVPQPRGTLPGLQCQAKYQLVNLTGQA